MTDLIVGYGYCGYYLAQQLRAKQRKVITLSRHIDAEKKLPDVDHRQHDINTAFSSETEIDTLYYLVPPNRDGQQDTLLKKFLQHLRPPQSIVYFGSSGVYGDQQGLWVDETTPCHVTHDRQRRRLDAETQWAEFAKGPCTLLRVAGIYGPQRIPTTGARQQTPIIEPAQAPWINHIYVEDLVSAAIALSEKVQGVEIVNIADGEPLPMGGLQQKLATQLDCKPAPKQSFEEAYAEASEFKREFLTSSKRLSIEKLKKLLGNEFRVTDKDAALMACR